MKDKSTQQNEGTIPAHLTSFILSAQTDNSIWVLAQNDCIVI